MAPSFPQVQAPPARFEIAAAPPPGSCLGSRSDCSGAGFCGNVTGAQWPRESALPSEPHPNCLSSCFPFFVPPSCSRCCRRRRGARAMLRRIQRRCPPGRPPEAHHLLQASARHPDQVLRQAALPGDRPAREAGQPHRHRGVAYPGKKSGLRMRLDRSCSFGAIIANHASGGGPPPLKASSLPLGWRSLARLSQAMGQQLSRNADLHLWVPLRAKHALFPTSNPQLHFSPTRQLGSSTNP